MTVEEFVELLKKTNPKATIMAYNGDDEIVVKVTGILYDDIIVEIQTDLVDED